MKTLHVLFLLPLAAAPALWAQAAPEPSSPFRLTPSAPPPSSSDVSLMPEGLPPLDKSPLSDKSPKDKTAAAEDTLRQRVKLREAKTKAMHNPAIQAEWDKSLVAKTDYEKREILKNYYKLLSAQMVKIDGSIKTEIEVFRDSRLSDLTQTRIAPTVPPQAPRAGRN